jgi:copper chaperone
MHRGHCEAAVTRELQNVSGVQRIKVDLETKIVTVGGDCLDEAALIEAIDEAGYEAELIPG